MDNEVQAVRRQTLQDFLDYEFSDYGHFTKWTITDTTEDYYGKDTDKSMFEVEYENGNGGKHCLSFRFEQDEKMEIEMSEDCWYKVDEYSSRVKYFWIMVKWD
jgi:hypothetical protein